MHQVLQFSIVYSFIQKRKNCEIYICNYGRSTANTYNFPRLLESGTFFISRYDQNIPSKCIYMWTDKCAVQRLHLLDATTQLYEMDVVYVMWTWLFLNMLNIDAYVIIFHLSDHIFRVYNLAANIFLITFKIDNESIFRSLSRLCWNFYVKINVNVIMILKLHGVRNKLYFITIANKTKNRNISQIQ